MVMSGITDIGDNLKSIIRKQVKRIDGERNQRVLAEAMEPGTEADAVAAGAAPPADSAVTHSAGEKRDELNLDDLSMNKSNFSRGDIDTLKTLTDTQVIEIASGDIEDHIRNEEIRRTTLGKKPGYYYSDIIFTLIGIRLPEAEAKRDWQEVLDHKYLVSKQLGRNIGIHVATLDYYSNIKKARMHPKILDAREYADTASAAITDPLTKAYNRRFFDEEFRRRFTRARVSGVAFSLLLLDLDHFKIYNDKNGHIQGDLALIECVRILHTVCSWRDVVARFGGEEFAIMLHAQPLEQALRTAEKIRKAVYDYRFPNEQTLPGGRLSISIGVTSYRQDIETPVEMIEEADVALYRSKSGGRNRVSAFLQPEERPV
jgi:diguanylate cyclase (GGDEF)-like protein